MAESSSLPRQSAAGYWRAVEGERHYFRSEWSMCCQIELDEPPPPPGRGAGRKKGQKLAPLCESCVHALNDKVRA